MGDIINYVVIAIVFILITASTVLKEYNVALRGMAAYLFIFLIAGSIVYFIITNRKGEHKQ
jgi:hypothetical protein